MNPMHALPPAGGAGLRKVADLDLAATINQTGQIYLLVVVRTTWLE